MPNPLLSAEPNACLADFTSADLMVPRLRGRDAATVIHELCGALQKAALVPDLLAFYQAALNREFLLGSTVSHGIALAHARVVGLARPAFALGRTAGPLVWISKESPPVRLVLLCAVPATEAAAYLLLTSGLAHLVRESHRLEALLQAPDRSAMLNALGQVRLGRSKPPPG
ncbi:MAG: PTS sugar transporter subunit IIA [Verrucomicrobia bacterium]|nr:PTS sugar transporter subunit IIA [Verrucomicrobiota bacterium]